MAIQVPVLNSFTRTGATGTANVTAGAALTTAIYARDCDQSVNVLVGSLITPGPFAFNITLDLSLMTGAFCTVFAVSYNGANNYSAPSVANLRGILNAPSSVSGDYIWVEGKVLETLLNDTGSGGLLDPASPLVKLLQRRARQRASFYGDSELPAIGIFCDAKTEPFADTMESFLKVFSVDFLIISRGQDILALEDEVKKIMARLEHVCRVQTTSTNQWSGLPAEIEYSDGVLVTRVVDSAGPITPREDDPEKAQGEYVSYASVRIEITVPCGIDL